MHIAVLVTISAAMLDFLVKVDPRCAGTYVMKGAHIKFTIGFERVCIN